MLPPHTASSCRQHLSTSKIRPCEDRAVHRLPRAPPGQALKMQMPVLLFPQAVLRRKRDPSVPVCVSCLRAPIPSCGTRQTKAPNYILCLASFHLISMLNPMFPNPSLRSFSLRQFLPSHLRRQVGNLGERPIPSGRKRQNTTLLCKDLVTLLFILPDSVQSVHLLPELPHWLSQCQEQRPPSPSPPEAPALLQPRPGAQCPAGLQSCLHPALSCVRDSCSSSCWKPYPLVRHHHHGALPRAILGSFACLLQLLPGHWVSSRMGSKPICTRWVALPRSMLETSAISKLVFLKASWIFSEDSRKQFQNVIPEPKQEQGNTSQHFTITHPFHYFILYF